MRALLRSGALILLCVVANYGVAAATLYSRWGTAFFMEDDFHKSSIAVSVAAGLILGLVQMVLFGLRISLIAMGIGLWVGLFNSLLIFTLLTQTVGIAVGCLLVSSFRWRAR